MVTNSHSKWGVRLGTLVFWAAAGATVVYWGLRWSAASSVQALPAIAPAALAVDASAVARLLGAEGPGVGVAPAPVAALANRFVLMGVLSGRSSGGGAALIAVDGKPAKPYRVGAWVDDGLVLQGLGPRQARLGASAQAPAALTLDMPLGK